MKKLIAFAAAALFCIPTARAADDDFRKSLYFSYNRIGESIFSGIATEKIVTPQNGSVIYLNSGNPSADISAQKLPLNSTDGVITYSSDNPHISVNSNGTVTSDGEPGMANITLSCGDVSITYPVFAMNSIYRFALSETELTLYADRPEPAMLSVVCEPDGINPFAVNWYSGDESIAHVDENGIVVPNGIGTTSIYAKTIDGSKTAKCTVRVGLYDVSVKAVFITNAIDKIKVGSDYTLSAFLYPDTVSDKTIVWESSDSTVLSVTPDGTIHGAKTGAARITARGANGKSDFFDIEVVPANDTSSYTVISKSVAERIAELSAKPQFEPYNYTLDDMTKYQTAQKPVKFGENRKASAEEVKDAINPSSNASGYGKYQFIDLSRSNNIDVQTLNRYLSGKGVLDGKGQQFKDAADRYGLSELYLVTHACLESGDGKSQLARGVDVNGAVVYNLFGIGAYDSNAVLFGSRYAHDMGWTSVDAAIDGGARWISENYINNPSYRQNTLYKMRWNPDSPGQHQYATDIDWALAQAKTLKSMFDAFPDAELYYEIPLYKGEREFPLK